MKPPKEKPQIWSATVKMKDIWENKLSQKQKAISETQFPIFQDFWVYLQIIPLNCSPSKKDGSVPKWDLIPKTNWSIKFLTKARRKNFCLNK
jgi:hypothetical protein